MPNYHIILGKKHMDLLYAKDEEEAILIIEKKFGVSSKYNSIEKYKAVKA